MSVKRAINDQIPHEWDYVLRKNKVLTKAINYLYRDNVPSIERNKYNYRRALDRLRHLFRNCRFIYCFDAHNTFEGYEFWCKIDLEIIEYQESIR